MRGVDTINTATSDSTITYFYDSVREVFGFGDNHYQNLVCHGFKPTHEIIVDADLSAQQVDAVLEEHLFSTL